MLEGWGTSQRIRYSEIELEPEAERDSAFQFLEETTLALCGPTGAYEDTVSIRHFSTSTASDFLLR